jgi:transcriptional regulator with XRE-family HTH domain
METNMAKNMDRAKFVKKAREERAWPQRQLAEAAKVNLRTIQRLEKDGSASFETLMAVAGAFDIDVRELNPTSKAPQKSISSKKVYHLPRLNSGKDLFDIIGSTEHYEISHDESDDARALGSMMDILKFTIEDIEKWRNSDPIGKFQMEQYISRALKEIEATRDVKEINWGCYFFGGKREVSRVIGDQTSKISMGTIYISHSRSHKIIRDRNSNMVIPALLNEVVNC